jgi:hypothetical protein
MPFTQNLAPTFVKQPRRGLAQIANADGSSQKTVVTAGGNGSKVLSLYATSTDTSARDVQIAIVRSATTYILGTVSVPANSGNTNSAPTVDLLQTLASSPQLPAGMLPIDNDGQHFLFVESGDTLVVLALTTVTAAKVVSVHSDYGDL